ncbi:MAG: PilZ domain-containing protein [Magnetococcales bacterium]|nr:PilZ domain-containing protein [Magnetococcales bacterium]
MDAPPPDNAPSRRRHERVWFKCQATLNLPGGKTLWGMTRDVSLRGIFLAMAAPPTDVTKGATGTLRLTVNTLQKEFPCRVAHVCDQGVGIELNDQGENFGAALTASLLQETQVRLGADVCHTDFIRVARQGNDTTDGRLTKISISHMEFTFIPSSGWNEPKPGDELRLAILQPRMEPLPVNGVVRTVLKGEKASEKTCALLFTNLSDKTTEALKKLVQSLHDQRLRNLVTQRTTAIGLNRGGDTPRWARPEVRQRLERFYGPGPRS